MDVGSWLRSLGLGQYEAAFNDNSIAADILPDLTDGDLVQLGVNLGDRKRLLKAIANLSATGSAARSGGPAPASPSSVDAAKRRQLTVMFCDLVGSTAMSARLDPEDMRQVIRAYQDAVSGVVARYDGFVAKFMGDGVLAYFGFPRAHEDDAAQAVHAALEIAEAVARLQTRASEKLAVRVGIATGLVVGGDLVGLGSAQERHAQSGGPAAGPRRRRQRRAGGFDAAPDRRPLPVEGPGPARGQGPCRAGRGVRGAGRVAKREQVRGCACGAARGLCRARGRDRRPHRASAPRLGRPWPDRAHLGRSGHRQVAPVRLACGAGRRHAAHPAPLPMLSLSSRQRALSLRPAVRAGGGHRAAGAAGAKLDKLEKVLGLATDRVNEVAPLIASMLSISTGSRYPALDLSAAQQRRQTLSALLDQMEGLAKTQPVLMLFEDAHWADATSLEVLDLAIERVQRLPVLFLRTAASPGARRARGRVRLMSQ